MQYSGSDLETEILVLDDLGVIKPSIGEDIVGYILNNDMLTVSTDLENRRCTISQLILDALTVKKESVRDATGDR